MSDEAAPQSSETPQGKIEPIDRDALYLFTGAQLEEALMQVAGATSGVFMREDPEKVMPATEVADAVDEWAKASPELIGDAGTKGALLRRPLAQTELAVAFDAGFNASRQNRAAGSESQERARSKYMESLVSTGGAEPSPSTQPQFAVHDEVEVSGHHAHTLPPLLENVELPLHGKVVKTEPHSDLIGVQVELPSGVGTRTVQLHVDQVELERPSPPEAPQ